MRLRKLLPRTMLSDFRALHDTGIPMAKLLRDSKLDITLPTLNSLIYLMDDENAQHSLFPGWLGKEHKTYEQPVIFGYDGTWPYGEWYVKDRIFGVPVSEEDKQSAIDTLINATV